MKNIILILFMAGIASSTLAQNKYFTRNGIITFFSETPLENIEAKNNQVSCIIDFNKSEMVFAVLMKSFVFPKTLMEEHFNENYVESDKFPKATYKGKIKEKIDPLKDGIYKINTDGELTIHGVTKLISLPAQLEIKQGKIYATASFPIVPEDYQIKIPGLVKDKIAKQINVKVAATLEPSQNK